MSAWITNFGATVDSIDNDPMDMIRTAPLGQTYSTVDFMPCWQDPRPVAEPGPRNRHELRKARALARRRRK